MSEFILGDSGFGASRYRADGFQDAGTRPFRKGAPKKTRVTGLAGHAPAIALAALGIVAAVAVGLAMTPGAFRLDRYEIRGAKSLTGAEVLSAGLVRGTERYFSADAEAIRRALLSEPRILSAAVRKEFPSTLKIDIVERSAAAVILADVDGRLRSVAVDAEGVAFGFADAQASDLPVLSGIRFEGFKAGTRLPAGLVPTLASIAAVGKSSPSLLSAFSEIKIVKPASGEIELVLFPLHHRVHARTGAVLNESTLRSIILVLDVLESGAAEGRTLADGVEEIDFRSGTVVYRVKGGQAG